VPWGGRKIDGSLDTASSAAWSYTDGVILWGRVSVHGHSSAAATLAFSALGIHTSGSVASVHIPETNIIVKDAELGVLIGSKGNKIRVALKGTVDFEGLSAAVGLVWGETWMVYGRASSMIPLAKLCPVLENTYVLRRYQTSRCRLARFKWEWGGMERHERQCISSE